MYSSIAISLLTGPWNENVWQSPWSPARSSPVHLPTWCMHRGKGDNIDRCKGYQNKIWSVGLTICQLSSLLIPKQKLFPNRQIDSTTEIKQPAPWEALSEHQAWTPLFLFFVSNCPDFSTCHISLTIRSDLFRHHSRGIVTSSGKAYTFHQRYCLFQEVCKFTWKFSILCHSIHKLFQEWPKLLAHWQHRLGIWHRPSLGTSISRVGE